MQPFMRMGRRGLRTVLTAAVGALSAAAGAAYVIQEDILSGALLGAALVIVGFLLLTDHA